MSTQIGPRRKIPPKYMPDGFEPPYDSFEPRFKDLNDLVMVIFGIERRSVGEEDLKDRLCTCFTASNGPEILEHAGVQKGFGPDALLWFAYWKSLEHYMQWEANSGIEALFSDDSILTGECGLWREFCRISLDHNETSFSRDEDLTGLVHFSDALEVTPIHAYWGSMRDRIVAAGSDDLDGEANLVNSSNGSSLGRRVKIKGGKNLCLIKTTQDWTQTNTAQLTKYETDVRPAYEDGVRFISDNGKETGCIAARLMSEHDASGNSTGRTVTIAFWNSMADLEKWTHSHPTHNRIMGEFMGMVEQFQGDPGLGLWHEVSVFPEGWFWAEYVNCSADGTLMKV